MKYLAILFGACFALAGCVVETDTGNSGGTGGSGTGGSTGGAGVGGGTGGSATGGSATGGSATGGSGTGGSAACVGCGEYITTDDPAAVLCDGPSTDLYDALAECTCAGACAEICADSVCAGADLTTECQTCVTDTAAGCGTNFNDCANDI